MTLATNNLVNELLNNFKDEFDKAHENNEVLQIEKYIKEKIKHIPQKEKKQIEKDFFEYGPLTDLLSEPQVTEILCNSESQIFYETQGKFYRHSQNFLSKNTYNRFVFKILSDINMDISQAEPFVSSDWKKWRVQVIGPPISSHFLLSFRKSVTHNFCLKDLLKNNSIYSLIMENFNQRKNFLIIGPTGSGKTTFISALLKEDTERRFIILEDTKEILLSHPKSIRLTTFQKNIGYSDLIYHALRMRPESLVLGEARGSETKDFLMALSTGHRGSLFSIHSQSAKEALLRLEMLIQMGAPEWNLESIRRLITLSVDILILLEQNKDTGTRRVHSVYKIAGLESSGLLLETLFTQP